MSQQLSQQQPILLTNGINSAAIKTDHEEVDLKIRKLEQVRFGKRRANSTHDRKVVRSNLGKSRE